MFWVRTYKYINMIRALIQTEQTDITIEKIPDYLIREEIDGKPYYYQGYKKVLSKEKNLEEIMGASTLQSFIVEILIRFLIIHLDRKTYRIFTNEIGNHIQKGTNLSFDIAIFDRTVLTKDKINEYYASVPPKMVFEVDVKMDVEDENAFDYIDAKTEKLLEYGTELVVWILTNRQKILVARPNQAWEIIKWEESIELFDSLVLNIADLIKEDEALG